MRTMKLHSLVWGCLGFVALGAGGCEDGYEFLRQMKDLSKGGGAGTATDAGTAAGDEGKGCQPIDAWKRYAEQACAAAGQPLIDYFPYEDCGDGTFRGVKYECAAPSTPPPPDPGACTTEEQGGDTSCKPTAVWKGYAADACQAAGLALVDYSPADVCGDDLFRYVKYRCCKP
jgi:hypothetical protein